MKFKQGISQNSHIGIGKKYKKYYIRNSTNSLSKSVGIGLIKYKNKKNEVYTGNFPKFVTWAYGNIYIYIKVLYSKFNEFSKQTYWNQANLYI